MIIDESIANISRTVAHLTSIQPDYRDRPAIVASPKWWVDQVREAFAHHMLEPTDEVDQVGGCKLVVRDDLQEPFTIAADGRLYPVLPGWARAANLGKTTR